MSGEDEGEHESRRAAGYAAESRETTTRAAEFPARDRDPPPSYDGDNYEVTFRQYEKQVELLLLETEVPRVKRGIKLLRQLSGVAATAVDDMEVKEIAISLPRAFETAVYGPPRGSKESFAEYTKRMDRAFHRLGVEGVELPDSARGYIMRLDKVLKEKAKGSYVTEESFVLENPVGDTYDEDLTYAGWEDEDPDYIFLAEGDLDEVMDEQDVMAALAAYQDTRQALKDQRLGRGYFPGKGKGKVNSFQKGKEKGKRRVHIETSSEPARTFFVGLQPGSESVEFSSESQQYWLRNFVKERKSHSRPATDSESEEAYMERACVCLEGSENFCGITTKSFEGIVDTAAEGGLVGRAPLARLEKELLMRGLRTKWTPKQTSAKGVGGNAVVEGVALIPLGIESIRGVLETTVVQGDVPLLLPVRLLVTLAAKIDLKNMIMELQNHQVEVPLHPLPSGHVTVNILSFAAGRFDVPREAGEQSEFEVNASCFMATAMPVQSDGHQFDLRPDAQIPPSSNGVLNPRVPLKHWRIILDKIGILLVLAALQDATEAWCLELGSQRQARSSMDSIEDYYAEVIMRAPALKPLQSKTGPTASASSCIHPKNQLKGGGNGSSFYIVCKACHSRWAHSERSADVHKLLKHGPLSIKQGKTEASSPTRTSALAAAPVTPPRSEGCMLVDAMYGSPSTEGSMALVKEDLRVELNTHTQMILQQLKNEQAASTIQMSQFNAVQLQQMSDELRKATLANREQDLRQEKLMQLIIQQQQASPAPSTPGKKDPRASSRRSPPPTTKKTCLCGKPAEALIVKKEGPRKGPGGHRGGEDGGVIIEPEEVQEPEKGGLGVAGDEEKSSGGDDGGVGICAQHRLDEGELCREDAGGRCVGRRVRRLEEAPALTKCSGSKAVKWAKKAQAGEHVYLAAKPGYSTWREELWTHYESEIPEDIPEVYVEVYLNRRGLREEEWGEEKQRQLSRKERRELAKAIKSVEKKSQVILGEIYSPPRIALHLRKKGYQVGSSFDLQTGWDLSQDNHRRQMWRILREERPEVLVVSPPCTAFSRLQAINWGRMMPGHQSLAARNDVKTVVCDQCMFGMNVDGMGLNRKRTKWLSNIPEVLEALDVGCDGSHTHRVLENGRPKLAQVYPEELCRTVAQAIIRFHHTRKLGHYPVELDEEEEEEGPGPEMPRGEAPGNYEPSEEEKKAIMKVHRSVGHPHQQEFIRFLRAARVQGELIQWAYKHFKCDVCQANAHPKVPRPTALPRAYQPNRVIGLDLFYVPSPGGGKQTTPVLNIIDWGTNYQMCELLDGKNPAEVWGAYLSTWARTFGHPEVITCDAGPLGNKGGHFKDLLNKVRSEVVVQSPEDLKRVMAEVEMTKNRYSNRSGFAPVQRQIGQWPRLPTSIMSDEAVDPTLLGGVLTDDLEKLHHMRRVAQKAFCEHNAKNTYQRSMRIEEKKTWSRSGRYEFNHPWWKGVTTFYIKDIQEVTTYLAEKKGQDEVNLKTESAQDLEEWKQADLSEWNKVTQSGAKVLGLEESQRIRRELQEQGKGDRILPTKIARRYKPGEQPGEPATKKSRLCIRGDLDPDILELERFAPTLNTVNFNITLQVAANENMTATVGDLKNAFCQSQPLCRPNGPLYFQQPKEGVIGLRPDQIAQIVAGCYGLVDAPLHWRKSLTEDLKALGYEMSALDPCIMKLYDKSRRRLLGAIAIEVDDLFTVGHQEHHEKMKQPRTKYTFGKYVALREEKDGCAFNGRRIRQLPDGGYLVDMQKFIEERLRPVDLEKGRKSQKKEPATPEEVSMARATCGALNWLSREGRPDASGPSSLMASKLSKLTVEDLVQLNQVVDNLKEHAAMSLKIQPLKKMRMSVVTDASFANNGFHSQGGHLVLAHERELRDGLPARANIIAWRSGKLQRVVNSTLAAETQSLSRGLAELMWVMVLAQELQDGTFNVKKWRDRLENEELMVMSSERSENTLKEALAVVDAKSLYDHLSKDTLGGQDRRTAIEIQIVRQDLKQVQGCVKWVHHLAMPADGLTKVSGSNKALYELIQSGMYSVRPAEEEMENRAKAQEEGQTNSQLRRIGIKEKGRNCETKVTHESIVDPNHDMAMWPNAQGP
ncbi:Retrovirus-related Pol polyprotein from transposon RE2 (Retro element 2) (AtRE2) [Includes: Protease RE2 [Durusdinium trenchii]|uniref:Retrovirus-related Pol polyprotein from transposon RE2 (Retro element 2) (AtRE2) n=1 Tax=Durusdinium trenchii TaxID=1381693 RepID=A0ABP0JCL8_9DINO